jgi:endonuclease G
LYVVTGPVFRGENLQALNGRVLVPTQIFKAVYEPGRHRAGVYLVNNANDTGYESISVEQLAALSGIDVFPSLPADVKGFATPLPAPSRRFPRAGSFGQEQVSTGWWFRLLHAVTGE